MGLGVKLVAFPFPRLYITVSLGLFVLSQHTLSLDSTNSYHASVYVHHYLYNHHVYDNDFFLRQNVYVYAHA